VSYDVSITSDAAGSFVVQSVNDTTLTSFHTTTLGDERFQTDWPDEDVVNSTAARFPT
jgi:hypothetical protein